VVAIFANRLLCGERIQVNARVKQGDEGCVRDYVFVGDVVRANLAAIDGKLDSEVVNVGTGEPTTTHSLAKIVEQAVDHKAEITFGPHRAGDLERSVLQIDEFKKLGTPVTLEKGIVDTVAWFRKSGPRG
jgi:UDP-glucose 4-epimerase